MAKDLGEYTTSGGDGAMGGTTYSGGTTSASSKEEEEIKQIIEGIKGSQARLGVQMPEPPESLVIPTTDCSGGCAIAFVVDVTQCGVQCPAPNTSEIYIQSSPTATPVILADTNGNPYTSLNITQNNTPHPWTSYQCIAKFEDKIFVSIKYYGGTVPKEYKLVKLQLHANCTASVIWTKHNWAAGRAMCAVDENTLLGTWHTGSQIMSYDLNGTASILQYNPSIIIHIGYQGINDPNTPTTPLITAYGTSGGNAYIEDLVYIPSSDIVAVLINGSYQNPVIGPYTPEILTFRTTNFTSWGSGWSGSFVATNPYLNTSGPFPTGGVNYQAPEGNMSLYCYNGNVFTHNSEGNIWEWEVDGQTGDVNMVSNPTMIGFGSLGANAYSNPGYGDAASSPACCDGRTLPINPCPEIGDIGPEGGLVFAIPYTGWNNTQYYYEVALEDAPLIIGDAITPGALATGGTPVNQASSISCLPVLDWSGQSLIGAEFGAYNDINLQTPVDFGKGKKNTDMIDSFTNCPVPCHPVIDTHDIAATICKNYNPNLQEKDKWFLPSLFEFWHMCSNVGPGTAYATTLNLSESIYDASIPAWNGDGVYWTSSNEIPYTIADWNSYAWAFINNVGAATVGPYLSQRCSTWSVRPIRRFLCELPPPPPPPIVPDPGIEYDYRIQSQNTPGGIKFISHNRIPSDVPGFPMNPMTSNPPVGPGYTGPYPNYTYPFDLAWDEAFQIGGKWMYMVTNNFDIRGNQLAIGQTDMQLKINTAHLPTMPTVNNSSTGVPITIKIYSQDEILIAHYEYERFWMTQYESQNTFWNAWFTGISSEPFGDPGVGTCPAGFSSGTHCSWKTKWRLYNEVYSITPGQIIDLNNYSGVNASINDQSNTAGPIGYVTLDWVLSGTTVDFNSVTSGPNPTSTNIPTDRGNTANLSTHSTGNKRITDINNFPSPGFEWPHTCNDCATGSLFGLASHRHMLEVEPTPSSYFWNNTIYTSYLDSVNGVVGGSCGRGTRPVTGGTQAKLLSSGCSDFPTLKELKDGAYNNASLNKYKKYNKNKYR